MPTFNLGGLGRFEISRLPPSHRSSKKRYNPPSTPPPEYAETETKYLAPSQAQPPECKMEQVRRFLIEIVAITYNANFDELNAALYDTSATSGTNTVLCDSERADLLAQSSFIRKVHTRYLRNEKTMVDGRDEEKICAFIMRPVKRFGQRDFTIPWFSLDMIGWYSEQPFEDCMRAMLHVFDHAAPNDRVHGVLWKAWDEARRRCNLGELCEPVMCWPFREAYQDMGKSLEQITPSEP